MTEPDGESKLRGMKATPVRDGNGWVLNGTTHFNSNVDLTDYSILVATSGQEDTSRGAKTHYGLSGGQGCSGHGSARQV